jgi:hypothetical protein
LADDPIRLKASATTHALSSEQWQRLLEAAEESGSLRQSAIAEIVDQFELEPLEFDALCRELEQQGIELIDDEGKPPPLALLLRRRPTRSSSSCATRADTRS